MAAKKKDASIKQTAEAFKYIYHRGVQIGLTLFILLVFAFVFSLIQNVHTLNASLADVAQDYVQDLSTQITGDIAAQLKDQKMSANAISQRLAQNGQNGSAAELQKMLVQEAENSCFDSLHLIWPDKHFLSASPNLDNISDEDILNKAFSGKAAVGTTVSGRFVCAVPVRGQSDVQMVLLAVSNLDGIRRLLTEKVSNPDSWSCIADENFNIIASTDKEGKAKHDLPSASTQNSDWFQKECANTMDAIRTDVQLKSDGVKSITNSDGNERLIAYNKIPGTEWVLITSMPGNLLDAVTKGFLIKNLEGTVILITLLVALLIGAFYIFESYRFNLNKHASTDPVTEGNNLRAFCEHFDQLHKNGSEAGCTIMLLNVKGFKLINENFGFNVGNNTLKHIYTAVESGLQPSEFMCRNESDHFFVCLNETNVDAIEKRYKDFERRINSSGGEAIPSNYEISIFAGAYIMESVTGDLTAVLERVRVACEAQRKTGKSGCGFFTHRLRRQMEMEKEINALFDLSIEQDHFKVYLQPKVCLKDGKLGGAEALVRWMHPLRGLISPGDFIPILERSDRICKLDFYVFQQVCIMLNRWRKEGRDPVCVSVNLSRRHFTDPNFLDDYFALMQEYDLPSNLIEFELTESLFVDEDQMAVVEEGIERMHIQGNTCSIDDFGSGFSSMSLLKNIVADTIKLDRAFFTDADNPKADRIIKSMVSLGHNLELTIVAEGIEDRQQLLMLRDLKCDMIQGYVFSPPLPIQDFESWWQYLPQQWEKLMAAS